MRAVSRTADVLLVEDNPGDARLTREAFDRADHDVDVSVATNGTEALDRLHGREGYDDDPPDLVLLDLHLPGTDGREILQDVKGDPALRRVPVIVFTSSAARADVLETYELHANAFITKPTDLEGFDEMVDRLEAFWLDVATLPPTDP